MDVNGISKQPYTEGATVDATVKKPTNEHIQKATIQPVEAIKNQTTLTNEEKKKVDDVIKSMNDFLLPMHTSLRYKIDDETKQHYVQIINDAKGEVIKEIPSRHVLNIYAEMTKFIGVIFDKKV